MPMICTSTGISQGRGVLLIGLSAEDLDALHDDGALLTMSRATNGMAMPEGLKIIIVQRETYDDIQAELRRIGMVTDDTVIDQRRPV